ncbi:type VI secretion system Vgr family protein [Halioxenophilus aromaticivorans]|uniref:Type VI secretion system tip protein TssI/VgrG n=1 Tax=Halioxenophilus aromaticivorans TaxID=1306992 RepID=A0AAV3U3L8_9ALTE
MAGGLVTQDKRLIRLTTVLAQDELIPARMTYNETMGDGFTINVDAFSEINHDIQARDLVGTAITLAIVDADNNLRYFNGLIQHLRAGPSTTRNNHTSYHITVVSWLQLLLSKRNNYRIFQDTPIPSVIKQVFADYGGAVEFDIKTTRGYKNWRYLVQYDETDLNFVYRLLALEGLSFFFEHANGQHTLKVVDDSSSLASLAPKSVIDLHPNNYAADSFTQWTRNSHFATGKHELVSYNYNKPSKSLFMNQQVDADIAAIPNVANVTSYSYSGDYTAEDEGSSILKARVKRESAKVNTWSGSGNVRTMAVGKNFSIIRTDGTVHPDKDIIFSATKVSLIADDINGALTSHVTAVKEGHLYYPSATAPKVPSLQTARVVGKKGQEIQTDEHGRIKVRFHWDRNGRHDGQNTCFLRVMQGFASSGFGMQFTPRVGDEVVIAFENGNPDRPFVIGSLYNSENNPPYADQNGLRSGVRTRSSLNGGEDNCNELYFHDEKGKEEVYFQAEKDHNVLVKNNQTIKIGNDKKHQVVNNETHDVGNNLTIMAGNKILVDAGNELKLQVGSSTITITSSKIEISSSAVAVNGSLVTLN